jgi:hypothetical protein
VIYTEGGKGVFTKTQIPVNILAYLLGFYLGNGWASRNRLCFSVEKSMAYHVELQIIKLKKVANFTYGIVDKSTGSVEIRINSKALSELFLKLTSKAKALDKFIPQIVFSFSESNIRKVIAGMLDSDGCFIQRNTKFSVRYNTISEKLANDFIYLLKFINVTSSVHKVNPSKGGIINDRQIIGKHPTFIIIFSGYEYLGINNGHKGRRTPFKTNIKGVPMKVTKIEVVNSDEDVFDLSVQDTENFVANDLLVHNSATPRRKDGMESVFKWHIGDIIAESKIVNAVPKVYIVPYKGKDTSHRGCYWGGQLSLGTYLNKLAGSDERNVLLSKIIYKLYNKDKQTLVLSDRLKILEDIKYILIKNNIPKNEIGMLTGKTKDVGNSKIILGTYGVAGIGADIPRLDALVFATPRVDIEQAVGRVLRQRGKTPVIIDIVDESSSIMRGWSKARIKYYNKENMSIV